MATHHTAGDSDADTGDTKAVAEAGSAPSSSLGGELLSERPAKKGVHQIASHAGTHAAKQERADPAPARLTSYSAYQKSLNAYWHRVDQAKHKHVLISEFPPIFVRPDEPTVTPPPESDNSKGTLPSLNDLTASSKQLTRLAFGNTKLADYNLNVVDEAEFKRRYSNEAVRVGQENGFDKTQVQNIVQSIYAFEDGGWGTYETLSGMPQSLVADDQPGQTTIADLRKNFHPKSTGLGYNQLLRPTTMLNLDLHGADIVASLKQNADKDPSGRTELLDKADMVEHLQASMDKELKLMAHRKGGKGASAYLSKDGAPTDLLYETFAGSSDKTSLGVPASSFADAVHALNLDGDIGPIIQAQQLSGLLSFAHSHDFEQLLANEVTKTTTHANAYDAIPNDRKTKAIDELLSLVHPADITASSNIPIADQDLSSLRTKLLNLKAGADDSLARNNLSDGEYAVLDLGILKLKKLEEQTGPLTPDAALLLDKITLSYRGGETAESLLPASIELVNLAGPDNAAEMLAPAHGSYPTVNFFSRSGYNANSITNGRSAAELIMQIDRIMHGLNSDPNKTGQAQFTKAFEQ